MRVNLLDHLKDHPDLNLADLAFTLQVGRRAFPHRLMLVCQTVAEAVSQLETRQCFLSVTPPEEQGVVFMFPGQGPQYVNMGRELYDQEPIFRQQVDTCAALLIPYLHRDLREVIYPPVGQEATAQDQLEHMLLAQSALFVIEYALAQLWLHKGIRPAAMIGHSIGEYVAACLAGVLSLQDALFLVALRGRLMDQLKSGAMLAVSLPEEEVLPLLGARLSLAAHNSMSDCVVSGPTDDIGDLQRSLTEQQIPCQALRVSRASHSQMLEPVLAQFTHAVSKLRLHPPTLPYISNLTGQWITEQEATDPEYWTRHWRQTVRFAEGIQLLLDVPAPILLEVGPGRSLSTLAQRMVDRYCSLYALRHGSAQPWLILSSLRHPQAPVSDVAFLLNTCGRLWCAGVAIDWSQRVETTPASTEQRRRLSLPTYPFERERYWIFPAPNPVGTRTGASPVPTAPVLSLQLPSTRQQRPHLQTTYVAPRNEMEQQIAAIWQEVLGIEQVGIQDNFFEVGGDSLMGLYTINELREAFKVDLSLPLLLKETPTVEGMAKVIRQKQMELIDDEQLAEILQNISQISEEEALQLLEKNSSEPEGER
jgi:acyl transferase domain-containing protein